MSERKRIVLIHAVPAAMAPIAQAFARDWPEAECVNLLEDSLARDREAASDLTPAMSARIARLARYAADIGGDGILFTCSAFGAAIDQAAADLRVPVLKPNEAMFDLAIAHGRRIAMLYTFAPALAGMEAEFHEQARAKGADTRLVPAYAEGAVAAIRGGDTALHNALVAQAAASISGVDAIMLAHFSTSAAREAVESATDIPLLTAPSAAVARLKALVI